MLGLAKGEEFLELSLMAFRPSNTPGLEGRKALWTAGRA